MAVADCTCEGCGVEFRRKLGTKNAGKYCSRECYTATKVASAKRPDRALRNVWRDGSVASERRALLRIGAHGRKHRERIAKLFRRCVECSGVFMQRTHWGVPEVCCQACKPIRSERVREAWRRSESGLSNRRAAKSKRRARMRGLENDSIDPIKVFERDGWRCHLCKQKTLKSKRGTIHPKAPELDHIVSLADNGTHTWGNVACSCRACNGAKGARSVGQLGLGIAA